MRRILIVCGIVLLFVLIVTAAYYMIASNDLLAWKLHLKPSPQLVMSKKNYEKNDLSKFYRKEIIQYAAVNYQAGNELKLKENATDFLVNKAKQVELPEERLAEYLDYVNPNTDKVYLVPMYVERAKYSGEDSLIIVQSAGKPGKKLNQSKIWVVRIRDGMLLQATYSGDVTKN